MQTPSYSFTLTKLSEFTEAQRSALRSLSLAVYPDPDNWAGASLEWSNAQWGVGVWTPDGEAVSYTAGLIKDCLWNGSKVTVGGICGIKTHPKARRQGLVAHAIKLFLEFFKEQQVDFALLVCEKDLIPFYSKLGWTLYEGTVFVSQRGQRAEFTFNSAMTYPLGSNVPEGGTIDLNGPPW